MVKRETSYGIIPLKKENNSWSILLIQHGAGHWSFPKGHTEPNETPQQTASRELFEETSLQVEQFLPIETIKEHYWFNWKGTLIHKTVIYYPALVVGKVVIQEKELKDFLWCSLEEAGEVATFLQAKQICQKIKKILEEL